MQAFAGRTLLSLLFALTVVLGGAIGLAQADVCDVDADCNIDRDDIDLIVAARNTPADGPDDPRDADGDGLITALDARQCVLQCTQPRCAVLAPSCPSVVTVPDVAGQTQAAAEAAIVAAGLVVGTITEENNDTVPAGNVISQSPLAGDEVDEGSAVNLVISLGPQDTTPPSVTITSPASMSVLNTSPITVSGTVDDETASVEVNGVPATVSAGAFTATGVPLVEGPNVITATATDAAGNVGTASIEVSLVIPLAVTITDPANLSLFNTSPIAVSGTVDERAVSVAVNGIAATLGNGTWTADVPLEEGNNAITAVAQDGAGNVGTASVQVTLDTTPPRVTIDAPADGFVTNNSSITVAGMINDIVVGTVNGDQAQVTVNGIPAQVANRSFLAADVPLAPGLNTITATGTDRAGNTAITSISVTFEEIMAQRHIQLMSGNNQTSPIGSQLLEPLVVALKDESGNPVPNKTVIFKVIENNGTLSDSPDNVRSLALTTDAQGQAQARWTLGTRAGAGNNVVEAIAVGYAGKAIFTATALPSAAAKINVDAGNNQTGVVDRPLPRPFVAVVTDAGHNRLANVPVTFTVMEGGGNFDGQPSVTLNTDSDGRALAVLTLGSEEGFDNNVVEANFSSNSGFPAAFVASGKIAGDPAQTTVSGVVLDNTNNPIPGVTMQVEGTGLSTQTDEQGQFVLGPAPVGHVELIADGSTVTPGTWPTLKFELVTIAGRDNTLGMPIFLLPLNLVNALFVDETTGGTLTLPEVPGFSLTIAPGSATFPDGSKSDQVSVTVVHADKIPMTPNFGQQPRFIVTIQPPGVLFDPPVPITIPNLDGLPPGQVTELYSFDHDLGQFVSIGTGTVSDDGTVIASDPGVGIIKGGWHCGGDPNAIGTVADCPDCHLCQGPPVGRPGGSCEPIPDLSGPGQLAFCAEPGNQGPCVIAKACADESRDTTVGIFGFNDCGEPNAFFHAYTSCCISRALNTGFATDIGKAHEVSCFANPGSPGCPSTWDGCTDTLNDLHNNARGALLGELAGDCLFLVLDALNNGQLRPTPCP